MSLTANVLNGAAASESYMVLRINAVHNQSNFPVIFQEFNRIIEPSESASQLRESIDIPFISIADNIKDYVAGAYGKPYIPYGALIMAINGKKFGLWENERGVMCSISPQSEIDDESWPRKLLPNSNKHKPKGCIEMILPLLLKISKNGEIGLENTKNKS